MRANFVMKFSARAFLDEAFSTSSSILDTVDSPKGFVVVQVSVLVRFIQPLSTSLPSDTSRGRLSPVSAAVFTLPEPIFTMQSSGTFSPGFITIVSPTATSEGSTVSVSPLRTTAAVSGRMSISSATERREFAVAIFWKSSPT